MVRAVVVKRSGRLAVGASGSAARSDDFGAVAPRDPGSGLGRLCRAGVFTALSVGLATGAHRAAGGAVSLHVIGWAIGALAVVGWVAARRQRSGGSIAALVIGTQLLLHVSFAAPVLLPLLRSRGRSRVSALAALFLCHHSAVTAAQVHAATGGIDPRQLAVAAGTSAPHAAAVVVAALPMIAGHVAAAAAMAWWLSRGERAIWAAACRVVGALAGGLSSALEAGGSGVAAGHRVVVIPCGRRGGWLTRRGPPPVGFRLRLA